MHEDPLRGIFVSYITRKQVSFNMDIPRPKKKIILEKDVTVLSRVQMYFFSQALYSVVKIQTAAASR